MAVMRGLVDKVAAIHGLQSSECIRAYTANRLEPCKPLPESNHSRPSDHTLTDHPLTTHTQAHHGEG